MSDNKVILNYDGNSYEYPIVESTIGDRGIDISKLRDQTGLITLDLGYKNTGATLSNITYLDGDKGELFYRGYPIEQIAEKSNFTEVMYLLLQGELPTQEQFGQFQKNKGISPETTNMFNTLLDYYGKYQNKYAKHDDNVNEKEIEFIIDLTSTFMKFITKK